MTSKESRDAIEHTVREFVEHAEHPDQYDHRIKAHGAAQLLAQWCADGHVEVVFAILTDIVGHAIEDHDPRDDPYHPDNWADPREI